jgi:hypothetical protein
VRNIVAGSNAKYAWSCVMMIVQEEEEEEGQIL